MGEGDLAIAEDGIRLRRLKLDAGVVPATRLGWFASVPSAALAQLVLATKSRSPKVRWRSAIRKETMVFMAAPPSWSDADDTLSSFIGRKMLRLA